MAPYQCGLCKAWRKHIIWQEWVISNIQDMVEEKSKQTICWRFFNSFTNKHFISPTQMQQKKHTNHQLHIELYKSAPLEEKDFTIIH